MNDFWFLRRSVIRLRLHQFFLEKRSNILLTLHKLFAFSKIAQRDPVIPISGAKVRMFAPIEILSQDKIFVQIKWNYYQSKGNFLFYQKIVSVNWNILFWRKLAFNRRKHYFARRNALRAPIKQTVYLVN